MTWLLIMMFAKCSQLSKHTNQGEDKHTDNTNRNVSHEMEQLTRGSPKWNEVLFNNIMFEGAT